MYEDSYWKDRGCPWEYDPGPPKNLSWARLFSETPNYRGLSKRVLGREKFRWHFGPMYYRGRLQSNSVKVVVIGQEGAQDESLAHRSFVGGTGGRLQFFLNFIGIDYSYLFLNTFVYPIYGQYGANIRWLAQDPRSPIVKHRNKILSYVLIRNDVHLVIAVGTAAKESVRTWVEMRGGSCPDGTNDLSTCTGNFLDPNTKIVGVVHPGAAQGGNTDAIVASFQDAVDNIRTWINNDPNWLPVDPGAKRNLSTPYSYGRARIPFRDLPLGINWRLGRGSTSSNRKDNQRSIQLFSAGGKYNNYGDTILYDDSAHGTEEGYSEKPGDVPYEPPVNTYLEYDRGPGPAFAKLFMGGKPGLEWPDFTALGAKTHTSFGWGPVYRGRPNKAVLLILADQQSHDDLFMGRALTGDAGQRLQAYLHAIGIVTKYCIIRVFPVDTLDLSLDARESIATDAQLLKVYNAIMAKILSRNNTRLIITLGQVSATMIDRLNTNNLDVIKLKAWKQTGAKQDWQNGLLSIQNKTYPKEVNNPSFSYSGERIQIPRYDLPYGTLKWQGSSGDRARRAKLAGGNWSPDYYKSFVPDWVYNLNPRPLTPAEEQAVSDHP